MGVSSVWVKKLWRRYEEGSKVSPLKRPGRRNVETSEHVRAREAYGVGAVAPESVVDFKFGTHTPHNRMHRVLKEMSLMWFPNWNLCTTIDA